MTTTPSSRRGRRRSGPRATASHPVTRSAVVLFLAAIAPAAWAQGTTLRMTLEADAGATTNATGAPQGSERVDQVTSLRPALQVTSQTRLLKLDARVGAYATVYARGLQPDRVVPAVSADATATVVERLLFVDASVSSRAAERDPYAARSDPASTQNQAVVSVYRLSPHIDQDLADGSSVHARFEEIVSHSGSDSASDQRFANSDLHVTRRPEPFGGTISFETHAIHYAYPADSAWKIETLKASGDVALGGEFVVGPSIGTERTELLLDKQRDSLYGLHMLWTPGERTRLAIEAEHRFFGTGWQAEFTHRMPWLTFSVRWDRAPVTDSQSLGVASSGSALSGFLDAILTTRYPDATARAAVVDAIVANRGLQGNLQGAIDVRTDYVQLQNRLDAEAVFMGSRNIMAVGVYMLTSRALTVPGDELQSALAGSADSRQVGASLDFNRKLEPELTLDFNATWSRITSLLSGASQASIDESYRLALVRALSARTSAAMGLRHDALRTNLTTLDSYSATSAYVGMTHKF